MTKTSSHPSLASVWFQSLLHFITYVIFVNTSVSLCTTYWECSVANMVQFPSHVTILVLGNRVSMNPELSSSFLKLPGRKACQSAPSRALFFNGITDENFDTRSRRTWICSGAPVPQFICSSMMRLCTIFQSCTLSCIKLRETHQVGDSREKYVPKPLS